MRDSKQIVRFISTHPDDDHIRGIEYLGNKMELPNFYCVENKAVKEKNTESFSYYCSLRDGSSHYYVYKGCKRKWLNQADANDGIGASGIEFLWPIIDDLDYKNAIKEANSGISFNNISPIFTYSVNKSGTFIWLGDIEHDFLELIEDKITWPTVSVLFAPHHGRQSGKIPAYALEKLSPQVIIIGEAPSENLDYYSGFNTITQNSAGDIVFVCEDSFVHIYLGNANYPYDISFLVNRNKPNSSLGCYIGSLEV